MANPAATADAKVQPLPWVFSVAMRGAASRKDSPLGFDQKIDTFARRWPWPPLISTALGAEREQLLRLLSYLRFVARRLGPEQVQRPRRDWV